MTDFRALDPREAERLAKQLTEEFAPVAQPVHMFTAFRKEVAEKNKTQRLEKQLDAVTQLLIDERCAEQYDAQRDMLHFLIGKKVMEAQNLEGTPQAIINYAKRWSEDFEHRYGLHECHMFRCEMFQLPRGKFTHPVSQREFMSTGDFYICAGITITPGSSVVKYGSLRIHQCGSACEVIAINTGKVGSTAGFQHKGDDTGHCPITGILKHVQRMKTPGFNEAKISTNNLAKIAECDRKDYLGVDRAPKRRCLTRKKKVFDEMTPEMEGKFETLMTIITSLHSQSRYFRQCIFEKVKEEADKSLKVAMQDPAAPLVELCTGYNLKLRSRIPNELGTLNEFKDKSRYPVIMERVRRVWKTVLESPYVKQNSVRRGTTKRDKPVNPTFDNICAATIFAMAQYGIFIGYTAINGSFPERHNFCFLPIDSSIKRSAVPPNKVAYVLDVVKKAPKNLDNSTYYEHVKVITACVSSYVNQYAQEAMEAIKTGDSLQQAMASYIRQCEALVIP